MRSLERKIKYLWTGISVFIGLIFGSIISGILYVITNSVLAFAALPVLALLLGYYSILRYRNWGFELKEDHLYIEHGVLKKVYSMVPYVRVQHIDTNRGPVERVLGVSTLRVYTAGSKGADIKIPGLDREEAAELQKKLRDSAISSEKGFDAV